ncbi:hypothetical protein [Uliginosibacterium sp. 31-12]|uniref:hypothetical protein n=1 Tax=Uliginosibacterium sp. 31-12 TaxID=3062781 RepID=UPI0026E41620|nr:hypothetical protein [Uliginosibacterium sp. 31-12]MDO6385613.1 hypothetical protein [Uliginosibacterium sp. 31-12]
MDRIDPYTFTDGAGEGFFVLGVILLLILVDAYKKGLRRFLITLGVMAAIGAGVVASPAFGLVVIGLALALFLLVFLMA